MTSLTSDLSNVPEQDEQLLQSEQGIRGFSLFDELEMNEVASEFPVQSSTNGLNDANKSVADDDEEQSRNYQSGRCNADRNYSGLVHVSEMIQLVQPQPSTTVTQCNHIVTLVVQPLGPAMPYAADDHGCWIETNARHSDNPTGYVACADSLVSYNSGQWTNQIHLRKR